MINTDTKIAFDSEQIKNDLFKDHLILKKDTSKIMFSANVHRIPYEIYLVFLPVQSLKEQGFSYNDRLFLDDLKEFFTLFNSSLYEKERKAFSKYFQNNFKSFIEIDKNIYNGKAKRKFEDDDLTRIKIIEENTKSDHNDLKLLFGDDFKRNTYHWMDIPEQLFRITTCKIKSNNKTIFSLFFNPHLQYEEVIHFVYLFEKHVAKKYKHLEVSLHSKLSGKDSEDFILNRYQNFLAINGIDPYADATTQLGFLFAHIENQAKIYASRIQEIVGKSEDNESINTTVRNLVNNAKTDIVHKMNMKILPTIGIVYYNRFSYSREVKKHTKRIYLLTEMSDNSLNIKKAEIIEECRLIHAFVEYINSAQNVELLDSYEDELVMFVKKYTYLTGGDMGIFEGEDLDPKEKEVLDNITDEERTEFIETLELQMNNYDNLIEDIRKSEINTDAKNMYFELLPL